MFFVPRELVSAKDRKGREHPNDSAHGLILGPTDSGSDLRVMVAVIYGWFGTGRGRAYRFYRKVTGTSGSSDRVARILAADGDLKIPNLSDKVVECNARAKASYLGAQQICGPCAYFLL